MCLLWLAPLYHPDVFTPQAGSPSLQPAGPITTFAHRYPSAPKSWPTPSIYTYKRKSTWNRRSHTVSKPMNTHNESCIRLHVVNTVVNSIVYIYIYTRYYIDRERERETHDKECTVPFSQMVTWQNMYNVLVNMPRNKALPKSAPWDSHGGHTSGIAVNTASYTMSV